MAVVTVGEAETEVPVPANPVGGEPFTWDYLQTLPDDSLRRELVDGQLLVSPSPRIHHQRAIQQICLLLAPARPDHLEVVLSPCDWKLSATTVFVPDLMVVRRTDFDASGWFTGTPLLVIEVRSPSTAVVDRTLKRQQYEQYGAGAYWLIDPGGPGGGGSVRAGRAGGSAARGGGGAPAAGGRVPSLTALRLVDGTFREEATVHGDEPYVADFPFPVTVVPAALVE